MSRVGWGAVAAAVTIVALWGMALLSDLRYAAAPGQAAELRLSWRLRSEPEQACRRRTAEELARLPVHMREEEVCERRVSVYRLRVTLAGRVLEDRLVASAGARADRPLDVFAQYPLAAGTHALHVEFAREGADSGAVRTHPSSTDAPTHVLARPAPRRLVLDTTLTFPESRIFVVTYDDERQLLRVVGGT